MNNLLHWLGEKWLNNTVVAFLNNNYFELFWTTILNNMELVMEWIMGDPLWWETRLGACGIKIDTILRHQDEGKQIIWFPRFTVEHKTLVWLTPNTQVWSIMRICYSLDTCHIPGHTDHSPRDWIYDFLAQPTQCQISGVKRCCCPDIDLCVPLCTD